MHDKVSMGHARCRKIVGHLTACYCRVAILLKYCNLVVRLFILSEKYKTAPLLAVNQTEITHETAQMQEERFACFSQLTELLPQNKKGWKPH